MRALLAPVLAVFVVTFASGCALAASGPQTGLPVETITIDTKAGPHPFKVEIAADDQSRETGLMFRKTMAPDAGMLFDFHEPQDVSFWMENTILPLDMLFVRADGTIARVKENATPYSRETIPSGEPVQFVIELNAGRAQALGIKAGGHVHAPEIAPKRH
ncbi:MAG TPA: DUF192 domain-containing protein [Rhizomicrobium sp.]|nr:DUF192 domain-containing protein [Rhizomicrobium sp.]